MKKLVKLLVENKCSIPQYVAQLHSVFGDAITIQSFDIDSFDQTGGESEKESAFLTSASSAADFSSLKQTRLQGRDIIPISMNLQRQPLLGLNNYPKGTRALVINVTKFMAEETITQLCQAGYGHFDFIPWYPGCQAEQLPLAVTLGERHLVPDFVTELIDLGPRQINIETMVELAVKLHCEYVLQTRRFFDFFEKQYCGSNGVSILVRENQLLDQRLSTLVQMSCQFSEIGILGVDAQGEVFDCSFRAAELLGVSRAQLLGRPAADFLPQEALDRCRIQGLPVSCRCITAEVAPCSAQLTPITLGMEYLGAYISLAPLSGEKVSAVPSGRAGHGKGHVTKYRFSDICGVSPTMLQTVKLAQKMARTDASVLITGESGTGKELFAHAIHNSSARSAMPFVAINCAALPDSLLESELFGYEEGAFTGARKGGKVGLFELANTGSIFLDEIEGAPLSTQLKLLRVIQEREIMRVGGDRMIPIDVRIISASNQDLMAQIEAGKFRRDLFYRISTLPLTLPPLRQRREDILLMLEEFKSSLHLSFLLTEETKALLLQYDWPGNIRELRNCVEYLGCQDLPVIEPENLPAIIRRKKPGMPAAAHEPSKDASTDLRRAILRLLAQKPQGRKQLLRMLNQSGFPATEGHLRRELELLKAQGWVDSGTGRGGSRLTALGLQEYQKL